LKSGAGSPILIFPGVAPKWALRRAPRYQRTGIRVVTAALHVQLPPVNMSILTFSEKASSSLYSRLFMGCPCNRRRCQRECVGACTTPVPARGQTHYNRSIISPAASGLLTPPSPRTTQQNKPCRPLALVTGPPALDRPNVPKDAAPSTMNAEMSIPQAPLAAVELKPHKPPNDATAQAVPPTNDENETSSIDLRPAHSALSEKQRSALLAVASFAAAISPASTTTYYPAIITLARDLNVSITRINLSISVYQVSCCMTRLPDCAHSA
jgi:hypothetical protein